MSERHVPSSRPLDEGMTVFAESVVAVVQNTRQEMGLEKCVLIVPTALIPQLAHVLPTATVITTEHLLGDEAATSGIAELVKGSSVYWLDSAHEMDLEAVSKILHWLSGCLAIIFSARSPGMTDSGKTLWWPDQWQRVFAECGYAGTDRFRHRVMLDQRIAPEISQNLVEFACPDFLSQSGRSVFCPPSLMRIRHPAYAVRARWEKPSADAKMLSCVITFHNERFIAYKTLWGIERMRRFAETRDLNVQIIAVLDAADEITTRAVLKHPVLRRGDVVLPVRNFDLANSRNHGIDMARGEIIAISDGDDFQSEEWLWRGWRRCMEQQTAAIIHPEWVVHFGALQGTYRVKESTDASKRGESLILNNRWISCSMAPRTVYETVPYTSTHVRQTGFGYEDWHWNLETLAFGLPHLTATDTALFYRIKENSMVSEMKKQGAVYRPTAYFNHLWREQKSARVRT